MAPLTEKSATRKDVSSENQVVDEAKKEYNRIQSSIFFRRSGILTNLVVPLLSTIFVWFNTRPSPPYSAPTRAFQDCLDSVCDGAQNCVRNTEDISGFVKCAAKHNIKVQAKSGGHSYANHGLGGQNGSLSIDLQELRYVIVDDSTGDATIGAGSLLGDIDALLEKKGNRMFPHGVCPGVGIGGHATIGGLGPSSRMWGATLDHMLEAKVVIANGSIITANEKSNEDLFFALRGAGAGFGVVAEFKMRTHKKPETILHLTKRTPYTDSSEVVVDQFLSWQNLTANPMLDPRFGTEFALEPQGSKITGTWFGSKGDFESSGIAESLPGGLTIIESSWVETARWQLENAALYLADVPTEFYSRSLGFRKQDQLSRIATKELVHMVKDNKERIDAKWFVIFDATGGEVSKPAMDSTAYAHRDKVRFYQSYGYSLRGPLDSSKLDLLDNIHRFILENVQEGPHTTYPGYVDPYLNKPQEAYWGSNLPRLQRIKAEWDPKNVFENPQSVRPW